MTRPQAPPDPLLSPHDLAQGLRDIGSISKVEAELLEQRITAWGQTQKAAGRLAGITEVVNLANATIAGIKNATHKAASQRLVWVLQKLLPDRSKDYLRGYHDGSTDERRKGRTHQPTS